MMPKGHAQNPGYRPGNNWVTCDRCGFERRASDIKTEWNGLEVCSDTCFETRHPQDFLRAKEESITPARVGTKDSTSNLQGVVTIGAITTTAATFGQNFAVVGYAEVGRAIVGTDDDIPNGTFNTVTL